MTVSVYTMCLGTTIYTPSRLSEYLTKLPLKRIHSLPVSPQPVLSDHSLSCPVMVGHRSDSFVAVSISPQSPASHCHRTGKAVS